MQMDSEIYVVLFHQEHCEGFTASFIGVYSTKDKAYEGIELFIARLRDRCVKDVFEQQAKLLSQLLEQPSNKKIEQQVNYLQCILDQINAGDLSYLYETYGIDNKDFKEKFEVIRTSMDVTDDWESTKPYNLSDTSDDDEEVEEKMDD